MTARIFLFTFRCGRCQTYFSSVATKLPVYCTHCGRWEFVSHAEDDAGAP